MNELTLEARLEYLDQVLAFVDQYLESIDCPPKSQMQVDIAVEEVFVNIAQYAYAPDVGSMTLRIDRDASGLSITFTDSGVPFDPLAKLDPDVTLSAEEREIGGLGIFMVKKSMDSMEYKRENGQNILTIRKKL